ncbi:hypothetical protein ACSS31_28625 (plasmid) [Priestia megaterium]
MFSYEREVLEKAGYSDVKFECLVNGWKHFKVHEVGKGDLRLKVKKDDFNGYKIELVEDASNELKEQLQSLIFVLCALAVIGVLVQFL